MFLKDPLESFVVKENSGIDQILSAEKAVAMLMSARVHDFSLQ